MQQIVELLVEQLQQVKMEVVMATAIAMKMVKETVIHIQHETTKTKQQWKEPKQKITKRYNKNMTVMMER